MMCAAINLWALLSLQTAIELTRTQLLRFGQHLCSFSVSFLDFNQRKSPSA